MTEEMQGSPESHVHGSLVWRPADGVTPVMPGSTDTITIAQTAGMPEDRHRHLPQRGPTARGPLAGPVARPIAWLLRSGTDEAAWVRPAALGIGLLVAVLYIWNLAANGYANTYYAAAAQAASQSWVAWFFGSVDAGNFITVDKPPLSTMLMGLSVRVFGLSSWSILLPQALLGVASVLLLFSVVKRSFGPIAATIAGVVMALTPVAVLMFRFNNPDALLTFLLIAGGWAMLRAVEDGRYRWLIAAGIFVGLAFMTKYLQAYLVLPAFTLTYLIAAKASIRRRIAGFLILAITTFLASAWWVAIVQITPLSIRPFIGGSTDGTALQLLLGYDGLGRIFGQGGGAGTPSLFRLLGADFGGQISWLIPLALICLIVGLYLRLEEARTDGVRAAYVLWGGWLIGAGIVFSFMSGIVHSYYAVALAPAIAALVGAGLVDLWRIRARFQFGGIGLAVGVMVTAIWAAVLLARSPDFLPWLAPAVLLGGFVASALLVIPDVRAYPRLGAFAAGLALLAVLAAPTAFAAVTATTSYGGPSPSAGPGPGSNVPAGRASSSSGALRGRSLGIGGPPTDSSPRTFGRRVSPPGAARTLPSPGTPGSDPLLDQYLLANHGSATWIVAVSGAQQAATIELATGAPVMAMGGFSGNDGAPTLSQLQADVAAGTLRFVLINGGRALFSSFMGRAGGSGSISAWVAAHGKVVSSAGTASGILYDLA
jgi:4-amino-4-deoxy-L-arabinose transferase-like glycosyltransferase